MGVLPDDDLAEIFTADNELAVDIEFYEAVGDNHRRRAYILKEHSDGAPVDVNQVVAALPYAQVPSSAARNTFVLYNEIYYRIAEINPESSGIVNILLHKP